MKASSDFFCVGPYVEVKISATGQLNFCHAADNLRSPQHENISAYSVEDYFNAADSVRDARNRCQSGNPIDRCHRCYREENLHNISFRQRRNLQAGIFAGEDFAASLQESTLVNNFKHTAQPRFYHVSFSNTCNMACMMCDGRYSSRLGSFLQQAGLPSTTESLHHDWTTAEAWQKFCNHLLNNTDIMCLHVMGGEPMYQRRFKQLLQLLVEHQHVDFHVTVVTNGSIYDAAIFDHLKHFLSATVEVSIEGIGSENDYVRYGANTAAILANIKRMLQHRGPNFDIVIRSVPQALTVTRYHDLLQFCLDHDLLIDSNALSDHVYLRCNILPDQIKSMVIDRLDPYRTGKFQAIHRINARNPQHCPEQIAQNAEFVINHLNAETDNVLQLRHQFAEYCAKFDQTRQWNIAEYVPELADFVKKYGYDQYRR